MAGVPIAGIWIHNSTWFANGERNSWSGNIVVGKRRTQQLTLRTRIKRLERKTICFSRSVQLHDIVIGLFINRFEFGVNV
jgi:IS1 family transposase